MPLKFRIINAKYAALLPLLTALVILSAISSGCGGGGGGMSSSTGGTGTTGGSTGGGTPQSSFVIVTNRELTTVFLSDGTTKISADQYEKYCKQDDQAGTPITSTFAGEDGVPRIGCVTVAQGYGTASAVDVVTFSFLNGSASQNAGSFDLGAYYYQGALNGVDSYNYSANLPSGTTNGVGPAALPSSTPTAAQLYTAEEASFDSCLGTLSANANPPNQVVQGELYKAMQVDLAPQIYLAPPATGSNPATDNF